MSTGNMENNLRQLRVELRRLKWTKETDWKGMSVGNAAAYLPIYHHLFTDYSPHIAKLLNDKGIELYGKTDLRFMEGVYKAMRDLFTYKPSVTKEQFFAAGFAERKVLMATEIIQRIKDKHAAMAPKAPCKGPQNRKPLTPASFGDALAAAGSSTTASSSSSASSSEEKVPKVVNELKKVNSDQVGTAINTGPGPVQSRPKKRASKARVVVANVPPFVPHQVTPGGEDAMSSTEQTGNSQTATEMMQDKVQHVEATMGTIGNMMQNLVSRMTVLESRMSIAEEMLARLNQQQWIGFPDPNGNSAAVPQDGGISPAQFENLAAKVTLLTNRLMLLEHQGVAPAAGTPIVVYNNHSSYGNVTGSDGDTDTTYVAGTVPYSRVVLSGPEKPRENVSVHAAVAPPVVKALYNAAAYADSAAEGKTTPTDTTTQDTRYFSACELPSPIVATDSSLAQGQGTATSTPTDPQLSTPETHFISQESREKAERMYNMMAETKQMLNLPMSTPKAKSKADERETSGAFGVEI